MTHHPAFFNAGNAGPFTLDGTRSYLIGKRRVAIIDPGPDEEDHVRALASAVSEADEVVIVLTHGHADHARCAPSLAAATDAPVLGPASVSEVTRPVEDGDVVETDEGSLITVHTPGHTEDHFCYFWRERAALFAGDLLLGQGDTTWVAEYPGCVADYLASLERVRALRPSVVYPAHGPLIDEPDEALDRFESHRLERIQQARDALAIHPNGDIEELLDVVYGDALPRGVRSAARRSLSALVEYVQSDDG